MKKLLLLLFVVNTNLYGQSVPNGNFEDWTIIPYEEPNGWFTANLQSVKNSGVVSVTKVSGQSGFAARMETKIIGSDTVESYILNSMGDPTMGQGGVPYSQQPTTNYFPRSSDTAFLSFSDKTEFLNPFHNSSSIELSMNITFEAVKSSKTAITTEVLFPCQV